MEHLPKPQPPPLVTMPMLPLGTYNELRLDDTTGSEEVFLFAPRDINIAVINDLTINVGGRVAINAAMGISMNRPSAKGLKSRSPRSQGS